jgi:mRNA interferase RelE/StbE
MISKKNLISIKFDKKVVKNFKKFSKDIQTKLMQKIETLRDEPLSGKQLSGFPHLRRIRSGNYRIIYTFQDNILVILVLNIGHRKDIYRTLK